MVETRVLDLAGNDTGPEELIRYQLGNHLGSAVLELDDLAAIISYEEYSPYGSTTHQAVRKNTEAPKRYRYTAKERDEESGLYYHGARYYAPWLGRWTAADPAGLLDGGCLYAYCSNNPIVVSDPSGRQGEPPLPGFIGNDQKVGKLFEQAVVDVLGSRYGATTYADVMKGFRDELQEKIDKNGLGSNKQKGTGIHFARKSYAAVRAEFGKLVKSAGTVLDGLQVHHFDELAEHPAQALDTTNLLFTSGNAGTEGSGHWFAHEVNKARKAGIKDPVKYVLKQARERGVEPDVPELSASRQPPSASMLPDVEPKAVEGGGTALDAVTETGGSSKIVTRAKQALSAITESGLVQKVAGSKGAKVVLAVAPILASGAAKAAPVIGVAAGAADVASEAAQGQGRRAVLAGIGMSEIPFVSQAADLGLAAEDAGWVAKEILDPERKAEDWFYRTFLE
jgi:RHS repeat-associated protein